MTSHDQLVGLAPLYALDALTEPETREFEAHLPQCDACRRELDEHVETTASMIADEPAPPGVWERIVAEIGEEPPAAPVTDLTRARSSSAWRWLAGAAAAAALAFGGFVAAQLADVTGLVEEDIAAAADEAAEQPGSIVADFLVEGSSVARLVLTADGQGFVVPTDELAPLEESRTYQLWVVNTDEQVISAGAMGHDPGASTFTWTGKVAGFALTREVAGGVVSSEGDVVSVIEGL